MKARSVLLAVVVAGAASLTVGCAASGSALLSATPTIDPGPVALSDAAAGERYLSIICPSNLGSVNLRAVQQPVLDAYLNGEEADLTQIRSVAAESRETARAAAELLGDPYYSWPESVVEHVKHVRQSVVADLTGFNTVAGVESAQEYASMTWPAAEYPTAGQEVRLALDLSADADASCVGREDGHTPLLAEKAEREAKLTAQ